MIRWICCMLLLVSAVVWASPADELAAAPGGKLVSGYIAAFNSGDDATMRAFLTANLADSALKVRSVDDRLQVFRRMRGDMQHFELTRVLSSNAGGISVLVHSATGQDFRLGFLTESQPPNKLLGIRVEPAEGDESANNGPPLPEQAALDSISALLTQQTSADAFSGAVIVAKRGEPLLRKAYGLADREHNVPNLPDTKFNLGSIGKTFTQIAIARLMAEGKLTADDTLGKFLPDYPNADARHKVTVQMLLDHRSGIGDFFGPEFVNAPKDQIRGLKDYLPFFAAKPLKFAPGSQEQYSNGGYVVLGLIIEKLSGKSYYDYAKETVFDPAGMKDTGSFMSDEIIANRAIGYTRRWDMQAEKDSPELRSNVLMQPGRGSSAGGGYSTADDMLRFANALASGKIHSREGASMGIAGGSPGVNATMETGLPGGYTIIVLCNLDPPVAEKTSRQIRSYLNRIKA